MIRLVTREYLDLLIITCKKSEREMAKEANSEGASSANVDEMQMGDEVMMADVSGSSKNQHQGEELSELGKCVLQNEVRWWA